MDENNYQEHLGDGVYVSFDGYHVNLAVNHHLNHAVALEPEVIESLLNYFKKIDELKKQST